MGDRRSGESNPNILNSYVEWAIERCVAQDTHKRCKGGDSEHAGRVPPQAKFERKLRLLTAISRVVQEGSTHLNLVESVFDGVLDPGMLIEYPQDL